MPRNLSAWIDLTLHLFVMLLLIVVLSSYNPFLAATAFVLWLCLAGFARERCRDRSVRFERYCKRVIANVNELMNYAMDRLPQAVFVVDASSGRAARRNRSSASLPSMTRISRITGQTLSSNRSGAQRASTSSRTRSVTIK